MTFSFVFFMLFLANEVLLDRKLPISGDDCVGLEYYLRLSFNGGNYSALMFETALSDGYFCSMLNA
jgi:hypothetical protein